jgi:adenosylmethionine-8-amino-7-oxononanoate aminotransferase
LGFGRTDLSEALFEQQEQLVSSDPVSSRNYPALELADRIKVLSKGVFSNSLFCSSGSEAVEAALKIVEIYWQGRRDCGPKMIISFENGYHGCTAGALSVTQLDFPKREIEWGVSKHVVRASWPSAGVVDLDAVRTLFDTEERIAAVILEPIQGIGGIREFPIEALVELKQLCTQNGSLLIFDEVLTGFGRAGRLFAYEISGVTPDILLTSKGLTAGYAALSAISMQSHVMSTIAANPVYAGIRHGHTMSANPAACAVALKVLDILEKENIIERACAMGSYIISELHTLSKHPSVVEVRGHGLMIGVVMKSEAAADSVAQLCHERRLLLRAQMGVLQILPALTITKRDADEIVRKLRESMEAYEVECSLLVGVVA